jgi:hypothetical protein
MFYRSAPRFRIGKKIIGVALCLVLGALSLFAQGEQIFRGACAKVGSKYVLNDAGGKVTYELDQQKNAKRYAGYYVIVMGTLDPTGMIHVDKIVPALPPKITQAKSIYLYCDACPRGMAKAKPAALEALLDWNRFALLSSPYNADLVFIFSGNPYAGDYVTRDGPDPRPVNVEVTYMNVVDPKTGENLWGSSRRWGSLFVAKATRDLIKELREQLEEQGAGNQQPLPEKHRSRGSSSGVSPFPP